MGVFIGVVVTGPYSGAHLKSSLSQLVCGSQYFSLEQCFSSYVVAQFLEQLLPVVLMVLTCFIRII